MNQARGERGRPSAADFFLFFFSSSPSSGRYSGPFWPQAFKTAAASPSKDHWMRRLRPTIAIATFHLERELRV